VTAASRFAPGLPDLMGRLSTEAMGSDLRYAVTGTLAAKRWAPYAPARNAMIYANDPPAFAERLGLREVDAGANVLLAKNAYRLLVPWTRPSSARLSPDC